MSEAKWSITEAKCLQISYNKCASQRDAISPSMGDLMLSHSAGMHNTDISIAGICPNKFVRAKGSKRFHFASLHYIFSAYLPTHIKFLTEFHRIIFGTTCISFPFFTPKYAIVCTLILLKMSIKANNYTNTHSKFVHGKLEKIALFKKDHLTKLKN